MAKYDANLTLELIRDSLVTQRIENAVSILLNLHPVDRAEIFDLLDDAEQEILLDRLDIPTTADLLEELEDDDVLEAIESLTTERLADVLDEMEPDEAADLLGDLPPAQASEALAQMEDADEVIPLLGYPDETAGGLMTTSYIALRRHTTTEQAIQFLREVSPETETPYYLYVIDKANRLIGVVGLRELVVSEPSTNMEAIMDHELIFVTVGVDQEEVARIMTRYDLAVVPVVDEFQRLMGVITHDDILDVLEDEATEDVYRLANVADTDLDPQSAITEQLKGRLPWIYLNTATALIASWVISNYEWLIAQVAILAAFQSVVAGLGGNTASQNVAMIVRSLALGKITSKLIWRIMGRQILVGFLQGLAVGLVTGIAVTIWIGNIYLGIILGLALIGNMIIAGIIGTAVPLGLNALGQDPALASSVFVTAFTDAFGFFIFLTLAAVTYNYLT